MRHLIYIVLVFAVGCSQSNSKPGQTEDASQKEKIRQKVDSRPGMKGVMIGSTIEESRARLKRVDPISGLKLDDTTELNEEKAVSFSLADSLQKVGDYELGRITGRAYNDTIYTLKTNIHGEVNVKGMRKVLGEVYGEPIKNIFDQPGFYALRWSGSDVTIYYDSERIDGKYYSILKIHHIKMADKLFEEPDPYDHDAANDF